MTDNTKTLVPVWTLATGDIRVPAITGDEPMTADRLADLRGVLATLADRPIATLEAHPLPAKLDRNRGLALDAASPLAQHLSQLILHSAPTSSAVATTTLSGEVLYRIVVPAKVAAQLGSGAVRSMPSKAVEGGVHSALVKSTGVAAQVTSYPLKLRQRAPSAGRP